MKEKIKFNHGETADDVDVDIAKKRLDALMKNVPEEQSGFYDKKKVAFQEEEYIKKGKKKKRYNVEVKLRPDLKASPLDILKSAILRIKDEEERKEILSIIHKLENIVEKGLSPTIADYEGLSNNVGTAEEREMKIDVPIRRYVMNYIKWLADTDSEVTDKYARPDIPADIPTKPNIKITEDNIPTKKVDVAKLREDLKNIDEK